MFVFVIFVRCPCLVYTGGLFLQVICLAKPSGASIILCGQRGLSPRVDKFRRGGVKNLHPWVPV